MTEIEQLKTEPPAVHRTLRDKIERVVGWVTAVISLLLIGACILLAFSGASTSSCINDNLGTRSKPSQHDAQAHIAFACNIVYAVDARNQNEQIRQACGTVGVKPYPAARNLRSLQFVNAVEIYLDRLIRDQAQRDAHPLGKC